VIKKPTRVGENEERMGDSEKRYEKYPPAGVGSRDNTSYSSTNLPRFGGEKRGRAFREWERGSGEKLARQKKKGKEAIKER